MHKIIEMTDPLSSARPLWKTLTAISLLILIPATAVFVLWKVMRPISEERLRADVITTIQREAEASFLVTGTLDIVATTTVTNTRSLLPGLLNVDLGTSRARVQVPGRAHYGFDIRKLKSEDIHVVGDTIQMMVPMPDVYAVEPNLAELRAWTDKGWLRTPASVQRAERRAIALLNGALTRQAKIHISQSVQPRINTARALERLLAPVAKSVGIDKPVFRFTIGESIVIEPGRR